MAESWTPPADGTPCWIEVIATDVARSREFYKTVFNWKFSRTIKQDGTPLDPNEIAMFEVPGQGCPGGGITRVNEAERINSNGKGGVVLYLYVDDIPKTAEKIINAGGTKMTDVMPEGKSAIMQHFTDTEGTYFGIYSMKK